MKTVSSLAELQSFLRPMMARAFHHALEVEKVMPILVLYLLANADLENGVDLKTYNDETANTGWIKSKTGNRYYIGYSHDNECIEIRKNNIRGKTVASIDNSDTSYSSIRDKLKGYI